MGSRGKPWTCRAAGQRWTWVATWYVGAEDLRQGRTGSQGPLLTSLGLSVAGPATPRERTDTEHGERTGAPLYRRVSVPTHPSTGFLGKTLVEERPDPCYLRRYRDVDHDWGTVEIWARMTTSVTPPPTASSRVRSEPRGRRWYEPKRSERGFIPWVEVDGPYSGTDSRREKDLS